jgi:hypothetical protein
VAQNSEPSLAAGEGDDNRRGALQYYYHVYT